MTTLNEKLVRKLARSVGLKWSVVESNVGSVERDLDECVEFVMHDVAHIVTLGMDIKRYPDLEETVVRAFSRLVSTATKDSLEIDAAVTTYLAGVMLRFWYDPQYIRDSCVEACMHNESLLLAEYTRRQSAIKREFNRRLKDEVVYYPAARRIVDWVKAIDTRGKYR